MSLISDKLRELRNTKNQTQKQIAEIAGVSERNYRKYEAGEADPSTSVIINLAIYYAVSTDYILCREYYSSDEVRTSEISKQLLNTIDICTAQMKTELYSIVKQYQTYA